MNAKELQHKELPKGMAPAKVDDPAERFLDRFEIEYRRVLQRDKQKNDPPKRPSKNDAD